MQKVAFRVDIERSLDVRRRSMPRNVQYPEPSEREVPLIYGVLLFRFQLNSSLVVKTFGITGRAKCDGHRILSSKLQ